MVLRKVIIAPKPYKHSVTLGTQYCQLHMLFCDEMILRAKFSHTINNFPRNKASRETKPSNACDRWRHKIISSHSRHTIGMKIIPTAIEPVIFGVCKARMFAGIQQFWFFGFFAALCLLCGLISLTDIQRGIIPNELNLLIAFLGLIKTVIDGGPANVVVVICEATAIGVIFWLLRRLYFSWRKAQGLGLGDVKFLAAAGAWIGIAGLPILLLIASCLALAAAGSLQLAGREMTRQTSVPFGPFLACGLVLTALLQRLLPL